VLGYFTERLDADRLRSAAVGIVKQAKRNKAFEESRWIGLAIDKTAAGPSRHLFPPDCFHVRFTLYEHEAIKYPSSGTAAVMNGRIQLRDPLEACRSRLRRRVAPDGLRSKTARGVGARHFVDWFVVQCL
jgi:hypothetical protein